MFNVQTYIIEKEYILSNRHCCINTSVERKLIQQRIINILKNRINTNYKKDVYNSINFIKLKYILSNMEYLNLLSLHHNMEHFWQFHNFDYFFLQMLSIEGYDDNC